MTLYSYNYTRINILQWILTKLGTYLVLKRIWNSIDFQGQGQFFRRCPCLMFDCYAHMGR